MPFRWGERVGLAVWERMEPPEAKAPMALKSSGGVGDERGPEEEERDCCRGG